MKSLKIIFAGTPDFAARHLAALIQANCEIVGVYTQPDRPAGRGKKLSPSAVKSLALEHQIPVFQPENFKSDEAKAQLAALNADLMIVVAYGLLLPLAVLNTPKLGCINVHGSLLPRWRGAAPIQRAIWAGDATTGVTIMQMDEGLDTGAMLSKRDIPILASDTSASLYDKLADLGPTALLETVQAIANKTAQAQPQDDARTGLPRDARADARRCDRCRGAGCQLPDLPSVDFAACALPRSARHPPSGFLRALQARAYLALLSCNRQSQLGANDRFRLRIQPRPVLVPTN